MLCFNVSIYIKVHTYSSGHAYEQLVMYLCFLPGGIYVPDSMDIQFCGSDGGKHACTTHRNLGKYFTDGFTLW